MRGSLSMKAIMSFWSKAWSPRVITSAPASSSSFACGAVRPMPPEAFSPFTMVKSALSRALRGSSRSTMARRPARPMTSPRNKIRMEAR